MPGTTAPSRSIGVVAKSTFSWATNREGVARRRASSAARSALAQVVDEERAGLAVRAGLVHDHRVEAVDHLGPLVGVAAPPRLQRGEAEPLAEQAPAHARPRNGCSASSPAAPEPERVGQPDGAEAGGVEQPGHALAVAVAELEGVGVGVVDPAEQHVDRLQAAERAQPDPTVADRQVAAFGQVVAELLGQVGVLEVARVAEAGREDDRAAVRPVLRCQRGERGPQGREERVEAAGRRGRGARRGRAGPGRCG